MCSSLTRCTFLLLFLFFFLMLLPPPTSTLFPYTTLFRSFLDRARPLHVLSALIAVGWLITLGVALTVRHNGWLYYQGDAERDQRSEEHTSELQSLAYLVCRLLLEKKKKKKK